MAKLAKEDLETFKDKQIQIIKKFDPKELKLKRSLPPIQLNNNFGNAAKKSSKNSISSPLRSILKKENSREESNNQLSSFYKNKDSTSFQCTKDITPNSGSNSNCCD